MVAYNFQARFAGAVESGAKHVTIREIGKRRHVRVGERVQLYTGQRTRACRKLVEPDPVVTGVESITFHADQRVWLDGWMTEAEVEFMARIDGFASASEFLAFHCPRAGEIEKRLIEWEPPVAAEVAA